MKAAVQAGLESCDAGHAATLPPQPLRVKAN